ncbi:MAG: TIGR02186 family protein [Pseudomonadota bacterium]
MRAWVVLICALIYAPFATAEEIVLGLSQEEVPITVTFDGSEILVFGAVKREAPVSADSQLHVIVTIEGPLAPVRVHRKARRFGIWVNASSVRIGSAPSFYAVASSGPLIDVLSHTDNLRHDISIPQTLKTTGAASDSPDAESFVDALIRIRAEQGLYQVIPEGVQLDQDTLFRTSVYLPPRLVEGLYSTQIYLTRDKEVIDVYETEIDVKKVGLERWLFNLALQQPLVYGLMALAVAGVFGWGASAATRVIRGG